MVYGVFGGYYSDWYVVGYFNNREDADKYCCVCGNGNYYVKPLKDLTNERDLSNIKLKYMHEIFFVNQNNKWIMREEPDRYTCYINDKLQCNSINRLFNTLIKFIINIDHDDRKLAEKIAQDYFTELRSYGDGDVYNEYIDLMNKNFREPFIEMERLKKEKELKERELAELARLKEKYEK